LYVKYHVKIQQVKSDKTALISSFINAYMLSY